ncbi:MAG: hypothetical protein LUG13_05535 [Oscillospiraceae bacterium]|nr:hypothetical protein [Oscillospiraceae bacterium]
MGLGALIPFASGTPVILTTDFNGVTAHPGLCGFGASFTPLVSITNPFDISSLEEQDAFMIPVDGTIMEFSAFFSTSTATNLPGNTATVQAQLWISTTPDNIFVPIPSSLISLAPGYTGTQSNGTISSGSVLVNYPVTANSRLMLVYQVVSANVAEISVAGFISAGVNIHTSTV